MYCDELVVYVAARDGREGQGLHRPGAVAAELEGPGDRRGRLQGAACGQVETVRDSHQESEEQ